MVLFFPRGLCWACPCSARRVRHEPCSKCDNVTKHFGSLVAVERRVAERGAGRAARDHRPERRRQDDVLQPDQRLLPAQRGHDRVRRQGRHRAAGAPRASHVGMARTFQITEIFPGAHGARERPHRRRNRPTASACARGSAAPRPRAVHASGRRDARAHRPQRPRPTGWSASWRTATSARPRSPWRWR